MAKVTIHKGKKGGMYVIRKGQKMYLSPTARRSLGSNVRIIKD